MITCHSNNRITGPHHGHLDFALLDEEKAAEDRKGIQVNTLLESKSFLIRRVSAGSTPHTVRFRNSTHTLGIFDQDSYIEGERRVSGAPIGMPGSLEKGIDVIPAHTEFQALVWPNSNINVTLISISANSVDLDKYGTPRPDTICSGDLLLSLASRIRESAQSNVTLDTNYIESLSTLLFHEVLAEQKKQSKSENARRSGGLSNRARRIALDFLMENLDEKIDLEDLAHLVGLSRFHFSRAFKVTFGSSPYKYLLQLRIRKASDLLKKTRDPITNIALSVGFSTSSEFSRAFRQEMHYTPREFRALNC